MTGASIAALLRGYRDRSLNPADVVAEAHARAVAATQPSWISVVPWDDVRTRLDGLPADPSALPLHGIPFAVKDNIDLAGSPTTAAHRRRAPVAHSAFVVERLLAAGAIPIGKTNMDQFATGLAGTRSPFGACSSVYDERSISGGSSSGSAVVVADGTVPFALATDTAGSGRVPAALNGIVGLKPSRGLLSTTGLVPACRSLDCISIVASTVADAAFVAALATGYDAADPFARVLDAAPPARPRPLVGVPERGALEALDDDARVAWEAAVAHAGACGWELVALDLEPFLEAGRLLYDGPWVAERGLALRDALAGDGVDPVVRSVVERGAGYSAADAFAAMHRLAELARRVEPALTELDAVLLPTAPTTFTHAEIAEDPVARNAALGAYTTFANLLDLAAIAVPAGMRGDGLPFGVQLLGPRGSDVRLAALAARWAGEPVADAAQSSTALPLAVCGAHLSGEPLNHQLVELGGRLLETTRTSADYRLYALPDTTPAKPGLVRGDGDGDDDGIEVELWDVTAEALGRLLAVVPPPLAIGTIELADGRAVKGFLCEAVAVADATDITAFGGWRAYLAGQPLPG